MNCYKIIAAILLNSIIIMNVTAETTAVKTFIPRKSYSFDKLICGSKDGEKFVAGRNIIVGRKKLFQPLTVAIAQVRTDIRVANKKIKRAKLRELKKLQALKLNASICNVGKVPTLVAQNTSFTGTGIQPVAVTLTVNSFSNAYPIDYDIVGQLGNGVVQKFSNLTALITPSNHRTGRIVLTYVAHQTIGTTTITSNQASVTVDWNQKGDFIGDPLSLTSYRDSLTVREARYLARWMNLGANADQIITQASTPGGLDSAVNSMLKQVNGGNCSAIEDEALRLAKMEMTTACRTIEVLDANKQKRFPWFCSTTNDSSYREIWTLEAAQTYFLHLSRYGCEPMRERIANFWSNHFAVNLSNFSGTPETSHYIKEHIDLLRSKTNLTGSLLTPFSQLISKMHGEDGAMLLTLNNNRNEYGTFGNENYARELLELFTMGRRDAITGQINYTEPDVYATSFAVMGWTVKSKFISNLTYTCKATFDIKGMPTSECARLPVASRTQIAPFNINIPLFDEDRWNHPTRPTKQLFFEGTSISQYEAFKSDTTHAGQDTITPYLLSHPGVARYIATRLITTFVTTEPSNDMVEEIANTLRSSNYAIEPAMAKLLTSSAFYARAGKNGIASPYETTISFIRGLNLPLGRSAPGASVVFNLYQVVRDMIGNAGQELFQHPTIFGYKELGKVTGGAIHNGLNWLNLQSWLERGRGIISYLNSLNSARVPLSFSWRGLLPADGTVRNPSAIVDFFLNRTAVTISDAKKLRLVSYLTTVSLKNTIEKGVTMPDPAFQRTVNWTILPEDQLNALIELKIPGLISIIAQLKEANVR